MIAWRGCRHRSYHSDRQSENSRFDKCLGIGQNNQASRRIRSPATPNVCSGQPALRRDRQQHIRCCLVHNGQQTQHLRWPAAAIDADNVSIQFSQPTAKSSFKLAQQGCGHRG
ncbi:MAG: hypothetical protein H6667_26035 [Ardenticatenaceae bacterium]|nr:hypothetical protein [Ardenticatenaceae bacterium]